MSLLVEFRSKTGGAAGTWRRIECQAFGAGWTRGATEFDGVFTVPDTAQCSIMLIDPNRDLDPDNASGAYYNQIEVGGDLRLTHHGVASFLGMITAIDCNMAPDPALPVTRIVAVDQMIKLAKIKSATGFYSGSYPFQLGMLLDAANVAKGAGERQLSQTGQATTFMERNINGQDFLSAMFDMTHAELGSVEFRANGQVFSRNRGELYPVTIPNPTLNLGCHFNAIPISEAVVRRPRDVIKNEIWARRVGGNWYTGYDYASAASFGGTHFERGALPFTDDGQSDTWAKFVAARSSYPQVTWTVVVQTKTPWMVQNIENQYLMFQRVRLSIDTQGSLIDIPTLRMVGVEWSYDDTGYSTGRVTLGQDAKIGSPTTFVEDYPYSPNDPEYVTYSQ